MYYHTSLQFMCCIFVHPRCSVLDLGIFSTILCLLTLQKHHEMCSTIARCSATLNYQETIPASGGFLCFSELSHLLHEAFIWADRTEVTSSLP